jgi:hypothetical protein
MRVTVRALLKVHETAYVQRRCTFAVSLNFESRRITDGMRKQSSTEALGKEERVRQFAEIVFAIAARLEGAGINAAPLTALKTGGTVSAGSEVEPRAPHNSIRQ